MLRPHYPAFLIVFFKDISMNSIRILLFHVLFGLSAVSLAQDLALIVPLAAGGGVDKIARKLADELQHTLGRRVYVDNRPGVNEFLGAQLVAFSSPNGSRLLVTRGWSGSGARDETYTSVWSKLVPVATIAGRTPVNEKVTYDWVGVFAPQGTPANILRDMEQSISAAVSSQGFRQWAGEVKLGATQVGFSPAPGSSASLAALVAQSGGAGSASIVTTASPAASGHSPSGGAGSGNNECRCIEVLADSAGEILRNTCNYPVIANFCVVGYCPGPGTGGNELGPRGGLKDDTVRIRNWSKSEGRLPWGYMAIRSETYFRSAQTSGTNTWTKVKSLGWVCSENRQPATLPGPHDKPVLVK